MSENETKTVEAPVPPDPIYQKSYSVHIAVASVALVGSVALAIADDVWLRRPYKGVQRQFFETYSTYLDHLIAERTDVKAVIEAADDIKTANDALTAATEASRTQIETLRKEFDDVDSHVVALTEALKVAKSEIAALTYEAEHHAHSAGDTDATKSEAAQHLLDEIAEIRKRKIDYRWLRKSTSTDTAKDWVEVTGNVADLSAEFLALQERKAKLQNQIGELNKPVSAARKALDSLIAAKRDGIAAFLEANPTGPVRERVVERILKSGASRYLDDYHTSLSVDLLSARKAKIDDFPTDPFLGGEIQTYQIHSKDGNDWVDRCQVCHLGALEPIPITADAIREKLGSDRIVRTKRVDADGKPVTDADGNELFDERTIPAWPASKLDSYALSLFESHPRAKEIFEHHDPEKVACSMCHSGNGVSITSVEEAHGNNKDWLWPAYRAENSEAGCIQCHQKDIHLDGGPRISAARESFLDKGCWGCHRYAGHDPEPDEITRLTGRIGDIDAEVAAKKVRQQSLQDLLNTIQDQDKFDAAAPANRDERDALQERISTLLTERGSLERRLVNSWQERIRAGPNLKDVKVKIRPEYLAWWIQDPAKQRPGTKMPVFRWWGAVDASGLNEEVKDVSAFLWQAALDPAKFPEYRLAAPQGGSIARGKQVFEEVGCLACHSMGTGENRVGSDFAANLTNLGDKDTYEYVYRWIKDPRHRLVPWSRTENRDLTRAEWEKADPSTLVWTQPTRMGDLRLSDDEARDVATYLTSQRSGATYPPADYLMDEERAKRGRILVINQGCAGCHEIGGLEHEKGIGRELTAEGSQPLDRLDFGHLTVDAQRGREPLAGWRTTDGEAPFVEGEKWYRPRGFFMHKLAKPDLYDSSKYLPDRFTRLRMPQFQWASQELTDMTSFLLGSLEPQIPAALRYDPDERGQAIRDGWWVVKKFNCQGCHPFRPGDVASFANLPWIREAIREDAGRDRNLPPTLVGEGLRVRPEWLARFLHDPSLGGGTAAPKSVRKHLGVRMPTFRLSEDDVAKLVRFFQAMANQPFVHQAEPLVPLTDAERAAADKIWAKGNCLQCHLVDGIKTAIDGETKAPNLTYAAERLRPDWMPRWIRAPKEMQPRTSMLHVFRFDEPTRRWVVDGAPELEKEHAGDHVDLIVRYIRSFGGGARR